MLASSTGKKLTDLNVKLGDIFTIGECKRQWKVTNVMPEQVKAEPYVELCDFEKDFLLGRWDGVGGAAYNATYEFCQENGLCDRSGKITTFGQKMLDLQT